MTPTETTLLALVLAVYIVVKGPERGLWALTMTLPFGVAAAFNLPALGNSSVLVVDVVAAAFVSMILIRYIVQPSPSLRFPFVMAWFSAMLAYSIFITVFGPRLFEGQIEVFTIGQTRTSEFIIRTTLEPSSKNISQLMRICISLTVGIGILLCRPRKIEKSIVPAVLVMTLAHFFLSVADLVTFSIGRPEWLSFIRNANYSILYSHQLVGLKRVIGGFAEASAAGNFSLSIFGFWLVYWLRGGRSAGSGLLAAASFLVVLSSGSSAAYVAVAMFTCFVFAFSLLGASSARFRRNRNRFFFVLTALLPAGILGIWLLAVSNPQFGAYFDRLLFSKLESASGVERMMWNRHALEAAWDSNLIGLGLGSIRTSNFLVACLSTLGLFGTLLYFGLLTSLAIKRPARGDSEPSIIAHASRAACLALFCKAIITKSSPDLEIVFFVFAGLAVLMSEYGTRRRDIRLGVLPKARRDMREPALPAT